MASRINKPRQSAVKLPQTHDDWHQLMMQALQLAEKVQDPRTNGLRAALAEGKSEAYLRKIGVICPADLKREFQTP